MSWNRELSVALLTASNVSKHLREEYAKFESIPNAPVNISTDVDRSSQELILQSLHAEFPDDAFIAEEKTPTLEVVKHLGNRLWIIDPIDGTRGFVTKNGQYSAMIGLYADGELVVGVVVEPTNGITTFASRGAGCWTFQDSDKQPTQVTVSQNNDLNQLTLTRSHIKPGKPDAVGERLKPTSVVETYSAGIKLAIVARGEADVYISDYPRMMDWDIAAGHLLVEEAGGKVTHLSGDLLHYASTEFALEGGILATNGLVHEPVKKMLEGFSFTR
jgi:3'(2'), 5'-bisphosphate nucleotidase